MNKFFTMMAMSVIASVAVAAETIEIKTPADFAKGGKVVAVDDGLMVVGNQRVHSAKSFAVDPAKNVTLSFDIRKSADTTGCMVYVGFQCLDEDKVMIMPQNVRCEWNSGSTLAENAVAGSKDIRINMRREGKLYLKTDRLLAVPECGLRRRLKHQTLVLARGISRKYL